jgi:hypothetical protein
MTLVVVSTQELGRADVIRDVAARRLTAATAVVLGHCGNQSAFKMNIEKLRLRVGSETPLKQFKAKLVVLSKQDKVLPEYGLAVIDPRRPFGLIDPMAPPTELWRKLGDDEVRKAAYRGRCLRLPEPPQGSDTP